MLILNADLLSRAIACGRSVKFVMNDKAVVFFPSANQHREVKVHGLSYEHEHQGNAVAGIVSPERVEIRFHSRFSDDRISQILRVIRSAPELNGIPLGTFHYQGRKLG